MKKIELKHWFYFVELDILVFTSLMELFDFAARGQQPELGHHGKDGNIW